MDQLLVQLAQMLGQMLGQMLKPKPKHFVESFRANPNPKPTTLKPWNNFVESFRANPNPKQTTKPKHFRANPNPKHFVEIILGRQTTCVSQPPRTIFTVRFTYL